MTLYWDVSFRYLTAFLFILPCVGEAVSLDNELCLLPPDV